MDTSKIRAGIIGAGNWTKYGHIPVLQLLPQYEITGIWSRRRENAEQAAGTFGLKQVFDDAKELIRHPEVDLVIVLPPAPQHAEIVRAAIHAGKDVYCEWPLTTTIADTEDLLARAQGARVRHVVGLQRRVGPSSRFARDLIADGYVGKMRSVRMHVSMEYFGEARSPGLAWTIDPTNFSHTLAIYGGHFLDLLFRIVGPPATLSAVVESQFPTLTLSETGEVFPNRTPDEIVVIGTLQNGAVFTVQIEGGKRNNSGLQIDITGMAGDLKISNPSSFGGKAFDKIEGAQGSGQPFQEISPPAAYHDGVPFSDLDASVIDLAHLYAAYARDRSAGAQTAPGFQDAVRLHRFINLITEAAASGSRLTVRNGEAPGNDPV